MASQDSGASRTSETMPDIEQPLLQFMDVVNSFGDPLLHFSSNFVADWVQIWAVGGHRSGDMNTLSPEG